jgi:hypothetical protein
MKAPLITFLNWSSFAVAFGIVFFAVYAATPAAAAAAADALEVPEPAALLLLGAGLSALAFRVRARRRT